MRQNRPERFLLAALLAGSLLPGCPCTTGAGQTGGEVSNVLNSQPGILSGFFPINPWCSHYRTGLSGIAECGFTVAGFFVEPADLPYCDRLGLKAVVASQLPRDYVRLSEMPDEAVADRIRQTVATAGDSDTILGYFIIDEPGAVAFHALGVAVRAVKQYAPGKLAYINLFPHYAQTVSQAEAAGRPRHLGLGTETYREYLERFVREVHPQFLSYDNYEVLHSRDLRDPRLAAGYFSNLLEVRDVARTHGLPFWNFIGACQIGPDNTIPSPANLAFQAYTTLAAGARGISWFRYYDGRFRYAPVADPGRQEYSLTWRYLQEVNRQVVALAPALLKLTSTGVYFTSPAPAGPCPPLPGRLVQSVNADTPVMAGEFEHPDGTDFVMLVNLSLERTSRLSFETVQPREGMQRISAAHGRAQAVEAAGPHFLTAGQGMLIRLDPPRQPGS